MKEYYSRLFLQDGSSLEEVKKAYRKLVKKFHPDKNQESNEYTEEFKLIQEAYEKLVNYLQPATEKTNFESYSRNTETTGDGLVKSNAKYAQAGEEKESNSVITMLIATIPLIFCGFYGASAQTNLIFQIILFVAFISLTILVIFATYKQVTEKN